MKDPEFTQGPWVWHMAENIYPDKSFHRSYGVRSEEIDVVEIAYDRDYNFPDGAIKTEADAALIASPPDLYGALETIVNNYNASFDHCICLGDIMAAEKVLAKARGEPK
jgi:hypothetical protein